MGGYLSGLTDAEIISRTTGVTWSLDNKGDGDVVVIPVDDSDESERAFEWYFRNHHRAENTVHVIHCCELEPPSYTNLPDYIIPPEDVGEVLDTAKSCGSGILERYISRLKEKSMDAAVHLELGRPGPRLVEAVAKCKATVVVSASRGRGLRQLGSTARYLYYKSPVPVALVPPQDNRGTSESYPNREE